VRISIALATWQGSAFLLTQLESLAGQVRLPDELVASDDSSDDTTLEILEDFAARAPFEVRILRQDTNLGYAGNFDKALVACTGDLVFLCDQDDFWFTEKLAVMERWAKASPKAMVFACNAELTDAYLVPSGLNKRDQIASLRLPQESFVMGCCLAVRRQFLDVVLPIPVSASAHDSWIVELADRFGLVERRLDVLQYYRQHGGNTSSFSANTIKVIGRIRRGEIWVQGLVRRLLTNGGLSGELLSLRMQISRINQRKVDLDNLVGPHQTEAETDLLQRKIQLLEARQAVRAASPIFRPVVLLKYWGLAEYRGVPGILGAFRDLFARFEPPLTP
jgi:glycosyltransferase involved in cell wall biosynthesis